MRYLITLTTFVTLSIPALAADDVLTSAPAKPGGDIVMRTAVAEDEDPVRADEAAAKTLQEAMGDVEPHVVLLAECFEDKPFKEKVLEGVASVFDAEIICGGSTYGVFVQEGAFDLDTVALLGIGGDGISVSVALVEDMGAVGLTLEENEAELTEALDSAGKRLAEKLTGLADAALTVVISDAHSPKNQLLLDGIQSVAGTGIRVTGGSVNKNAEQNWVYFGGKAYTDAAIALTLTADIKLSQAGRQAKDNDAVIATAQEGSADALEALDAEPFAALAFDCAGRMGKLDDIADELAAIRESLGEQLPLFGLYCAGEFGPADEETADETVSYGRGWHMMMTVLGR